MSAHPTESTDMKSTTKAFMWGLTLGVVILMIAKADALNVKLQPQQLQPATEYVEGFIERRSRRREDGSHPLCSGDLNQMNWGQRQRVANFGTPKWCP